MGTGDGSAFVGTGLVSALVGEGTVLGLVHCVGTGFGSARGGEGTALGSARGGEGTVLGSVRGGEGTGLGRVPFAGPASVGDGTGVGVVDCAGAGAGWEPPVPAWAVIAPTPTARTAPTAEAPRAVRSRWARRDCRA